MKTLPIALAALIALPAPTAVAAPAAAKPPTRAQLKVCPRFEPLDFVKIAALSGPGPEVWRPRMDARHDRTRGVFGRFAPPDDAQLVLRLWAGGGETQQVRTETSSLVWKGADGVWRLHRVDQSYGPPTPPPPPPPDWDGVTPLPRRSAEEIWATDHRVFSGELDPRQAEAIEAALADPCFALQPDNMPMNPPVRRGRAPLAPCSGVIGGTLEMRWADGRRRDVAELCGEYYSRGIMDAVMYARSAATLHESARVIDGETLDVAGGRVSLWGIDAPAPGQTCVRDGRAYDCGEEARSELELLVEDRPVRCTTRPGGARPNLAHCEVKWTECFATACTDRWRDLAVEMIAVGVAIQRRGETNGRYDEDQETARLGFAGIWAGEGWRGD